MDVLQDNYHVEINCSHCMSKLSICKDDLKGYNTEGEFGDRPAGNIHVDCGVCKHRINLGFVDQPFYRLNLKEAIGHHA